MWHPFPSDEPTEKDPEFRCSSLELREGFSNITLDQCEIVAKLGIGSFGFVNLVKVPGFEKPYALKAVSKAWVVKRKQQRGLENERSVQSELDSPFCIHLYRTFNDANNVYFLMDVAQGGMLYSQMRAHTLFDQPTAAFYAAQVVLALEHMHGRDIIYRDLKPENILLDKQGFIKVVDYGFAKHMDGKPKTWTLCGTPNYIAPEMVANLVFLHNHFRSDSDSVLCRLLVVVTTALWTYGVWES